MSNPVDTARADLRVTMMGNHFPSQIDALERLVRAVLAEQLGEHLNEWHMAPPCNLREAATLDRRFEEAIKGAQHNVRRTQGLRVPDAPEAIPLLQATVDALVANLRAERQRRESVEGLVRENRHDLERAVQWMQGRAGWAVAERTLSNLLAAVTQ